MINHPGAAVVLSRRLFERILKFGPPPKSAKFGVQQSGIESGQITLGNQRII